MRAAWGHAPATTYRGANHWPVITSNTPPHKAPRVPTPAERAALRRAEIARQEALTYPPTGAFLADCRECLDFPRRFGTERARDLWAQDHIIFTRHHVGVGYDSERTYKP